MTEATDRERLLARVDAVLESARGFVVSLEELRAEVAGESATEPPAILCEMLAAGIGAYARRPRITAEWEAEARRLLERDGVTFEQAAAVIAWLTQHDGKDASFWRRNVLSMPTFRRQWDRLVLAIRQDAERAKARSNGRAGRLIELSRSIGPRSIPGGKRG